MTEEEIKELYTINGLEFIEKRDKVNSIEIRSRLKYIDDFKAKKLAKFILDYTYMEDECFVVPTYRVLDALLMINQEKIEYKSN